MRYRSRHHALPSLRSRLRDLTPAPKLGAAALVAVAALLVGDVVAFAGPSAEVAWGPNLVTNSGFETNLSGWVLLSAPRHLQRVTGGHTGTYAVRLSTTTRSTVTLNDGPNSVASTSSGTHYTARAWVRTSTPPVLVDLHLQETAGSSVVRSADQAFTLKDPYWHQVTTTLTAQGSGHQLGVSIIAPSLDPARSVLVDEVGLRVPKPPVTSRPTPSSTQAAPSPSKSSPAPSSSHPVSSSTSSSPPVTSSPSVTTSPSVTSSHPVSSSASPSKTPTPSQSSSSAPSSSSPSTGGGSWWKPTPGMAWQWQLTTPVDTSVNVPVYDIDGFDNSASVVSTLHSAGRHVICYLDVGGAENYRPDYSQFPASVLGNTEPGWPQERYLDIRQISLLSPVMTARMKMCADKGFDAVEPDVVDGYTADTGFPLTAADQIAYNKWIANLAHSYGMGVALKGDIDQASALVGSVDFTINEQCFEYSECSTLSPFTKAGKAVFEVEYNLQNSQFCTQANSLGFSSMRKNLDLDAPRWPC